MVYDLKRSSNTDEKQKNLREFYYKLIIVSFTIFATFFGLKWGVNQFIDQQRYMQKIDVYEKALFIINQHILSRDIIRDINKKDEMYRGGKCGTKPLSEQEKNDTFAILSVVVDDYDILKLYLKILEAVESTTSPVIMRDDFINKIRDDLGYGRINFLEVNNGNSLIVDPKCIEKV